MLVPADYERVPGSGITAGVTDAGWETMSLPPDHTHIPGAGFTAGAPGPDQDTMPIPSYCERVPGNGGDTSDPSLRDFTLTMVFWSRCVYFKTGAGCDVPESPSRRIISIAWPLRFTGPPHVGSAYDLGWSTRLEVLGWVFDTDKPTVSLPPRKSSKRIGHILGTLPHVSR